MCIGKMRGRSFQDLKVVLSGRSSGGRVAVEWRSVVQVWMLGLKIKVDI